VPGRKGLSWKQFIQAHLEGRATRFNLASGIPVLCPSISEKASPSNTVRTLNGVHHRLIRAIGDGIADARLLAFELKPKPALGA
jgi:hypothetical protein